MTRIYLITGFLGAGKSTYLNNVLKSSDKKIGVLINEFGKISVDTIMLNKNGIDLVELKNGSIFCACLKDKFLNGLTQLIKMSPDEIYIESSGLADPSSIQNVAEVIKKQILGREFEFAGVICIIDAVYFLKQLEVLESVRRQVIHSHLIIINKSDLVDKTQIEKINKAIIKINPRAQVECTSFCNSSYHIDEIKLFDIKPGKSTNTVSSRPYGMTLEFVKPVLVNLVNEFFLLCRDDFYRAKGYVKSDGEIYKVDVINGSIVTERMNTSFTIENDELDKLVLIARRKIDGLKHIFEAVNNVFMGKARIYS